MIDKKEWFDTKNNEMSEKMMQLTEYLMSYDDSRYRDVALVKLEECYLWYTQMLHAKLAELVKQEEEENAAQEGKE